LAASKKPETSRRASGQDTKAYTFCESSQRAEPPTEYKNIIEGKGEFKKVQLDLRVPDKTICIGAEASLEEQTKLVSFLDKNNDVFA
jgi:hypothetical protein